MAQLSAQAHHVAFEALIAIGAIAFDSHTASSQAQTVATAATIGGIDQLLNGLIAKLTNAGGLLISDTSEP